MSQQQGTGTEMEPTRTWFGPFYFNKGDPRVFVPKRIGWGWTTNFARTWTYVIILAPAVITIAVTLTVRLLGH